LRRQESSKAANDSREAIPQRLCAAGRRKRAQRGREGGAATHGGSCVRPHALMRLLRLLSREAQRTISSGPSSMAAAPLAEGGACAARAARVRRQALLRSAANGKR
jgi:hypothetical protein